jgi:CheY-like chemotaxis protein
MLMNPTLAEITTARDAGDLGKTSAARKAVIVDGTADLLGVFETVLSAGRYDVAFVESSERAYSRIKHVQPNLVVLCLRLEDLSGFQVLTMLKLDEETRGIPILTYTSASEDEDPQVRPDEEPSESETTFARPVLTMN